MHVGRSDCGAGAPGVSRPLPAGAPIIVLAGMFSLFTVSATPLAEKFRHRPGPGPEVREESGSIG